MYMEALGAQGTSIVKLFSPILWHTQACVGSFYMLEFPVLLLCRFLFQSSRSYPALKAILAAEKKWSQGENSQFHSSRIGKEEMDKIQLLLTFSAKDFISFSLSKYRILAASEKDIQQYAFSAQAAISSLKKETMTKNIRTEEITYFLRWLWDINWACHISVWLTVKPTEMLCLPNSRKIQPKLLNHNSA